jgi:hypothetical protein
MVEQRFFLFAVFAVWKTDISLEFEDFRNGETI